MTRLTLASLGVAACFALLPAAAAAEPPTILCSKEAPSPPGLYGHHVVGSSHFVLIPSQAQGHCA